MSGHRRLICSKKGTLGRVEKFLDGILKSGKMNDFFKESFGNLIQQNTTVDLDDEDIADILADTLQRKYFEKAIDITERIRDPNVKLSSENLIAFDYKFDHDNNYEDSDEDQEDDQEDDHKKGARDICRNSSEYYCKKQIGRFYAESKGQIVFWNPQDETLLCKDILNLNNASKKYEAPSHFQFLTVLESEGKLLFVAASGDRLTVYSIKEEEEEDHADNKEDSSHCSEEEQSETSEDSHSLLKFCKQFFVQEEDEEDQGEIVFLTSDHVNYLFVVTEGQNGWTANIYALKNRNHELELLKLTSFALSALPKKVIFDGANSLIFLLSNDLLEIYKYRTMPTASLKTIFKIQTKDFSWHQATKKLLVRDSRKLYQFDKGKFRLIRVINSSAIPVGLTKQGVLCLKDELCFLSQKNPNTQKYLILPSGKKHMESLHNDSLGKLVDRDGGYESDVEPKIEKLERTCNAAEILVETPNYLLIYADVEYYQSASQRFRYDEWSDYGGTIYTQRLLKYDLTQREEKILEDDG